MRRKICVRMGIYLLSCTLWIAGGECRGASPLFLSSDMTVADNDDGRNGWRHGPEERGRDWSGNHGERHSYQDERDGGYRRGDTQREENSSYYYNGARRHTFPDHSHSRVRPGMQGPHGFGPGPDHRGHGPEGHGRDWPGNRGEPHMYQDERDGYRHNGASRHGFPGHGHRGGPGMQGPHGFGPGPDYSGHGWDPRRDGRR